VSKPIIDDFENALFELELTFQSGPNDFFFTEKELHSYFYHLCMKSDLLYGDYNLVHTEYPTPFKCKTTKSDPFIKKAHANSKNQRAHIDLVLMNPNYIDCTLSHQLTKKHQYLTGVGDQLFSNYIMDFYTFYQKFSESYHESVLLYAIEFKFHRHNYSGIKYPIRNLIQDINKLNMLREFEISKGIPFCDKIKSLVFVGDRISASSRNGIENIAREYPDICSVIIK
jgi:hypothetical protein